MSRLRLLVPSLAILALAGCATTGEGAAPAAEFVKTGEIIYTRGASASFSEDRVVSPQVNFSRRSDGTWGGVLHNQLYSLKITGNRIVGTNFFFTWEETLEGLKGQGQLQNKMFRFELNGEELVIRTGRNSLNLPRTGPNTFGNTTNSVILEGEALQLPMPQTVLALLGIFGS